MFLFRSLPAASKKKYSPAQQQQQNLEPDRCKVSVISFAGGGGGALLKFRAEPVVLELLEPVEGDEQRGVLREISENHVVDLLIFFFFTPSTQQRQNALCCRGISQW